ncbi:MAG: EamA family transporter [bacterium]
MDAHIIPVVLLAAFFHAAWNASVKLGDDKILALAALQIAGAAIALVLAPLVGLPEAASWPYLLASVALHFGYNLCLASAYRHGDFAQAYPLARGAAPLLVTLWGVFVLREALSDAGLAAVGVVIAGILIFATRRIGAVWRQRNALASALATACFIAAYTVVDGVGARLSHNIVGYIAWLALLDGALFASYALHRRSLREVVALKQRWRVGALGAALSLAAYAMVLWAMSQAPIAVVSALRETSIIIAALIGAYYFKEPAGARRIVASAVIFAGIVLLGWAET